ncbi:hypothetical protein OO013_04770 [Mangrovivirga sp. M17]|uniref:Uncharacterized protein n=1 Tax=Mangrovivirga halotolerans TaxID=2993936 RepID=A0ABT3RN22_9BACT|nr:hypothetical protein [Mangrovivirga halotolerans]MCX2743164.1 hypothetical protein [Mangrovivirga halotolerans]
MKTLFISAVLMVLLVNFTVAQSLQQPLEDVPLSNKCKIILKSGEFEEGKLLNTSENTHGITQVTILNRHEEKIKIKSSDIYELHIAMNDAVRFQYVNERNSSVKKMLTKNHPSAIPDDYIIYRNTVVNGNKEVLLQLLNPTFSSQFQVFYNPQARKSTSLEGEHIVWTGDKHRAFLVSKNEGELINVKKNNYKKTFYQLFSDCSLLTQMKKQNFEDLGNHILLYENCMNKKNQ